MIWQACDGSSHVKPLAATAMRLVESQEQIATLGYVDTLEEQAILEELLEDSKPPYPVAANHLHYLLKSPFRYPPLAWGSRFGRKHETGIFYGGADLRATLMESAYYRLLFFFSMDAEPPKRSIRTEHTLFSVPYRTELGIELQHPPFDTYKHLLTHKTEYRHTQTLGSEMRQAGVEAFQFTSARCPEGSVCVALFTPEAFAATKPETMARWLCEVSAGAVVFRGTSERTVHIIPTETFTVNGQLPLPA